MIGKASAAADHDKAREALLILFWMVSRAMAQRHLSTRLGTRGEGCVASVAARCISIANECCAKELLKNSAD
jgi:hypothetical protein